MNEWHVCFWTYRLTRTPKAVGRVSGEAKSKSRRASACDKANERSALETACLKAPLFSHLADRHLTPRLTDNTAPTPPSFPDTHLPLCLSPLGITETTLFPTQHPGLRHRVHGTTFAPRPYAHAGQRPASPLATPGLCGRPPAMLLHGQPSHGRQRLAAASSPPVTVDRRLWHASLPALAHQRSGGRGSHGQPLLGVPSRLPGRGQS